MKKAIKLFLSVMLILAVFVQIPMPATATEPAQFTYEDGVQQLREAMVNRQSPITVQVLSDSNTDISEDLFSSAIAHTGVADQGDYLYRHLKGLNYSSDTIEQDGQYLITVTYTVSYRTTAQQEAALDAKVEEILDRLNVYDATDYEKIAAVYDYICSHVSFDIVGATAGGTTIYTAYGALVEGIAVCQGYASAFYRLALELGVDTRLISGKVGETKHGWNIVKLGDCYYHVDTTKDAGFQPAEYHHFLKCDLPTHTRDSSYDSETFHDSYPMAEADYFHEEHKWNEGTITKESSCKEPGVKLYKCLYNCCEQTRTEELPKLTTHTYGKPQKEDDTNHITVCQVCEDTVRQNHAWDAGELVSEATGYEEGVVLYTCSVCNGQREEYLPRQGWELANGLWHYYVDGTMVTSWKQLGGVWYHFDKTGTMATGWKQLGGVWYHLNASGAMSTGWKQFGGTWYYFESSGAMRTSWRQIGGIWYYFDPSGAMAIGWRQVDSIWYYFESTGAMRTGWRLLGNTWYYFHTSGAMATGTVKIGNVTYRFRTSGAWIS